MAHTFLEKTVFKGSSNPLTATHTCSNGSTVLVLTMAFWGPWSGTPTYNGIPMTLADGYFSAYVYYMLDPPTGSPYTISIPNGDGTYLYASASSYSSSTGKTEFFYGSYNIYLDGEPPSIDVTTTRNGALLVSTSFYPAPTITPPIGNKTELFTDFYFGSFYMVAQYELQLNAGLTTHNWSGVTVGGNGIIVIGAFNETSNCTTAPKYSGDTITMKATPRNGIGPYYVVFRKGLTDIDPSRLGGLDNPILNAPEDVEISRVYTLNDADIASASLGTIDFSVYISDSCPTTPQSCTQTCTINIGCVAPVCNFVVT